MSQPVTQQNIDLMRQVLEMAHRNRRAHQGRPFAAVVVDDTGRVLGRGVNNMRATHDMTAHAEMEAIRDCCRQRQQLSIEGLSIYASGHPCPMCLSAIVAGKIKQVFFAFDNVDAEPYGLSSEGTYQRLQLPLNPPPLPITRVVTDIRAEQLYGDAPWP